MFFSVRCDDVGNGDRLWAEIITEYKSGNSRLGESQCDQAMVAHGEERAERNEDACASILEETCGAEG